LLSPADMVIIGAAALIFFGPDQLPRVARRAGQVIRDVQNTSQSFIREMERAADASDSHDYQAHADSAPVPEPPLREGEPPPAPAGDVRRTGASHEDASGI